MQTNVQICTVTIVRASRRQALGLVIGLLCAIPFGGNAQPAVFPDRPVHIVVPFPAGGGVDVLIRAVAADLSVKWRQPVVIDNKPGAGSLIGADFVARAAADGYTLLATINQTVTSNRFLYKSLPYDPDKSFAPISLMTVSSQFLLANAAVPARNLKELVALAAKSKPPLAYGSFGNGSQPHLVYELLKSKAKIDLTHAPYKGVAPVMTGLVGGEIQLATGSASVAGELMRAGKVKALAIAGPRRSPSFPEVPTTSEMGFPQLQAEVWYALFAPEGTPAAVIRRISEDVRAILLDKEFARKNVSDRGLEVSAGGPDELGRAINADVKATAEMVKAAGVKPE
jgi:tripartite-type tricarboxylate transporter receptor subunit TctC